jgi:predicted nucleotidyltransferase
VYDDVYNHAGDNNWHHISSGSKAEGLDLPGSDFDVMIISKRINVYERDDVLSNYHLRTEHNLVLEFDNAMPGFTLLRIYDVREWGNTGWEKYNMTETSSITVKKKIYT